MSAVPGIEAIQDDLIAPPAMLSQPLAAVGIQGVGPGFGEMLTSGLSRVNENLLTSQTDLQRLATGDMQNLHHVMIRLEESRMSLQLMMQVRNRLLEAYQDVMKMQI